MSRLCLLAPVGALLLAACGGLETPVAAVSGRIVGASAAAWVYPLGRPDLKVPVAADGSYRFEAVPTRVTAFVLFDGVDRCELVPLQIAGGEENRIADRSAATMPLAGTVVAAAQPEGGAVPRAASFTVTGTDRVGLSSDVPDTGVVTLFPLPAAGFDVTAAIAGFRNAHAGVQVVAGMTMLLEIPLAIDPSDAEPGCGSAGGCEHGLSCGSDGRCYACVRDADCGAGTCDLSVGLCLPASGPAPAVCDACTGDAGCASGRCVIDAGAAVGYCSVPCAAGCPAGFSCDAANDRCVAPSGCEDWLRTMMDVCTEDSTCAAALAGGRCEHGAAAAGYCTAPCVTGADCRIGTGAAATLVCTAGWCAP